MMKQRKNQIRIGLIQMKVSGNSRENLANAIHKICEARKKGAQMIVLPELFLTPYFPQVKQPNFFEFAEKIPNSTTKELQKIAKTNKVVLIVPLFEKVGKNTYYNSAVVINANGSLLGTYRKMHIPDDPGFYEKFYFSPGNLGFQVYKTAFGKIGIFICWDQWFPEAARLAALKGADILIYPTAIGWDIWRTDDEQERERAAWQTIQCSHAIANGVYVAAVNRTGREENLEFWGSSFVAGPFGEIVSQASRDKEEILIADCDLSRNEEMKRAWPFFRDRRTDAYKSLSSLRGTK